MTRTQAFCKVNCSISWIARCNRLLISPINERQSSLDSFSNVKKSSILIDQRSLGITAFALTGYIQGLKNFAKLRFRVGEKQALGIAFAIANKQIREGMPTRGSYAFTKTGMRTMFIEEALRAITPQLEKVIGNLETEIINTIT